MERGAEANNQACTWVQTSHGSSLYHMGATILYDVAKSGHQDMGHLLLAHGADPTIPDFDGKIAIDVAKTVEIKQLLLSHQSLNN